MNSKYQRNETRFDNRGWAETSTEHRVNDRLDQAKNIVSRACEHVERAIRARPLTSLAFAAAIGVLAAMWSKQK